MKTYIISSTKSVVKSKKAATKLIEGWMNSGNLYDKCRVYEVEIKEVYQPNVKRVVSLEEEYDH
jgi:hypothetical protein